MKKTTLKLLAALLVVVSATVAGVAHEGQHPRGADQPVHRELGSYVETKVLPMLQQQRQKLELQLSASDRVQLASYRAQLKDNRTRSQALFERLSSSTTPQGIRPELSEEQLQQFRTLRTENWKIMQGVGQMAQKYSSIISQLMQEMQPQREQWASDMKAIVTKAATPEQSAHQPHLEGYRMHGFGGLHHLFRPATFLLRDPRPAATNAVEQTLVSTSIYPNPAAPTSQLEYQLKAVGPVTVDLLDNNGNKLRTLVSEPNAGEGVHTQALDLHDLAAGTYFYKITTKSGSETKRFVKE
jgi:hypothetical protein